jgi:drug/metabolite transporter superfamily protein YnfA
MVAALVIAMFFFRYWRQTRDRLFLIFAAGFFTFAVSRLILAFLDEGDEGRVYVYTLRLLAFALILAAIIDKNRSSPPDALGGSRNGSRPHRPTAQRSSPARH